MITMTIHLFNKQQISIRVEYQQKRHCYCERTNGRISSSTRNICVCFISTFLYHWPQFADVKASMSAATGAGNKRHGSQSAARRSTAAAHAATPAASVAAAKSRSPPRQSAMQGSVVTLLGGSGTADVHSFQSGLSSLLGAPSLPPPPHPKQRMQQHQACGPM
jgi:hypothetical protein